MEKAMRLDKFLVEMKKGSRSEVKKLIKSGRVSVDGAVLREPEAKIMPKTACVALDGAAVSYASFEYFMLNKPKGVVSATEDKRYKTAVDLIGEAKRGDLFPAGRLDIDTEGLLLITNDGKLAHRLLSPKKHVDKVYAARVKGQLPADVKERFKEGLTLEDGTKTLPAELEILDPGEGTGEEDGSETGNTAQIRLTIHEGKFHQVKRMFEAVGCRVVYLKRLSMGSLSLDPKLRPGEYRALTGQEIESLMADGEKGAGEAGEPGRIEPAGKVRFCPPLENKRAFLFDLDGTLVDSMWMWGAIDVAYLAGFGIECPADLQKAIEGMSFTETAVYFKERFSIADSLEQIKANWISMSIEKYRNQVPLKEGVREFLEAARAQGIRMAICTSNGRDMVDAVLGALEIGPYFDCVITGCEVAAGKPSPDIYLTAAERLLAKPEDCAVFEDVPAGILAGKRAGMTVFAVEDEFSKGMEEEKRRLADYYIGNYRELLKRGESRPKADKPGLFD